MNTDIKNTEDKPQNILIVDDMEANLLLLEALLTEFGYNVVPAINGKDALEKLRINKDYDLIISDILMPVMDGFMLCKNMKNDEKLKNIPFVFYTASYTDEKDEALALKLGAGKFIRKPVEPDEFLKIIQDLLKNKSKGGHNSNKIVLEDDKETFRLYSERLVEKLEKKVIALENEITRHKQTRETLKQSLEKLKMTADGVITALALTVEQRDPYTAGHQQRVSNLACAIADEMKLPANQIEGIRMAGVVHDIGKMHIPAEILSKPGKLNESEYNIVKSHAQVGYDILKGIGFPWPVADIVHQHHEHMDGSGYPLGLTDRDILMEAGVLCVADVVEAMASHRPYRPALGMDKALEEISKKKGTHYDARIVFACLKVIKGKKFQFEDL